VALVRDILTFDPHHVEAYVALGGMMGELEDWGAAERYYRAAITEKPDFADVYNNYGAYLHKRGQYWAYIHKRGQ
jgi:Tfp pilus assembly protein PilF